MTNKAQLSSSGTFFFKYVLPLSIFFLTFIELVYMIFLGRFLDKEFLFILIMLFFFLLILCVFFVFRLINRVYMK